ncbi:MAG: Uma2 family endonuclease [Prochloron sp. SP5CPC1]|nr:Uma2 family endonuclease [Candidatus Paraprochloron terpiosi SP5CPC1]
MEAIPLTIPSLTPKGFVELCQANQDLNLERDAAGEVILMSPTFPWTGQQNFSLYVQLGIWIDRTGLGIGFDSSTGFTLPNGAVRSPDVSWVSNEHWRRLTESQKKEEFSPLAPDFVVELRSKSDSLQKLQSKMVEYRENGVKLGWLIDSGNKRVEIYRPSLDVEVLTSPTNLSGENILPGFVLNLEKIW